MSAPRRRAPGGGDHAGNAGTGAEIDGRKDCGALRLRLIATKNRVCADHPDKDADDKYPAEGILDFDY